MEQFPGFEKPGYAQSPLPRLMKRYNI